jgi:hypothetical protein
MRSVEDGFELGANELALPFLWCEEFKAIPCDTGVLGMTAKGLPGVRDRNGLPSNGTGGVAGEDLRRKRDIGIEAELPALLKLKGDGLGCSLLRSRRRIREASCCCERGHRSEKLPA